ncbi:MAG: hypothetical protein O2960_05055 [Verrucomicrobia bacterium]|nr:hypothetical protein [Verrucomicrobiota bacterium]
MHARTFLPFGVVLYEILAGRKAFTGQSQASLMAAILEREPEPISKLQPLTPPALERVVRVCLAKDPDSRWQTAHDLKLQLRWILEGGSEAGLPAPVLARRNNRERIAWAAAAVAILGCVAFGVVAFLKSKPAASAGTMRFSLTLPEKFTVHSLALFPNGQIAALAGGESFVETMLWVRPLDSLTARVLPGTEGATYPFWSPDNRFIGFFANGKLKRIDVSGGSPLTVCDAADGRGGAWGPDGAIVFGAWRGPLYRVMAAGGTPRELTKRDTSRSDLSHRWPQFLPGGTHVIYLESGALSTTENRDGVIYVTPMEFGETKPLLRGERFVVQNWAADLKKK